ncbi:siroheme synthase [Desulfotomaculum nigrificans CO-1-SRB]|uniref:precorrin-2 dehydrogenase n=1 Tax=Desulfotomaculum nigrificans (strain DSM 14880 / VKM B-2319 / CO-1-SRB) TaxID=868595 RepID=F6B6M7_DESCC|nr:bifunctional precorrin-2 dehydrogenase/sirohydrochlorin ferrochelatase [Desulfotomaculum nigrificans]AEF94401.1 siroheme synthase [Desulfotomaculum nigrificans CO-1-SRB]
MGNLYPIYLNLEGQLCLVVGGGKVAERKIGSLLECGARVRLVSPQVTDQIKKWADLGQIELLQREYRPSDLTGSFLVFATTDNAEVNCQVARDCGERHLPVNVADNPTHCSFFVPSVIRRGKLSIAISTGGSSPKLAAKIRRQLESQFGPEYAEFLDLLSDVRRQVLADVEDIGQRQAIFYSLVESDILDLLKNKKYDQVKERLKNAYSGYRS